MGMEDPTQKNKQQLLQSMQQADKDDAEIEEQARDLLVGVRHQRDVRKAFGDVISTLPNDSPLPVEKWHQLESEVQRHSTLSRKINAQLKSVPLYVSSVATNTSTTSSAVVGVIASVIYSPGKGDQEWYNDKFAPQLATFNDVIEQGLLREQLELRLKRFQLDKDHGDIKSPLIRLQEAYLALNQANTELPTATSILIPLRDCIEGIVSLLLQRRPIQEKSGNLCKQIESIGKHCGLDNASASQFLSYGQQAVDLHSIFSRAKDKRMTRPEILAHFNSGIALIKGFLFSLDPNKLK
jgi:hypothetical protein